MNESNVIVSWSGGKDSCLACYKAMLEGYNVSCLVNTISREYRRVRFHGIRDGLIQTQAEAIGTALVQIETSGDNYERDFKEGVKSLISNEDIYGMVFGDIHLENSRGWAEKICRELGIRAIEPLYHKRPEEVLLHFIDSGFEAYVTSCQSDLVDKKFIGRRLDKRFLGNISKLGIDVCGENGEYHTVVTDGPIFKQRINFLESQRVLRDGYWFLDIRKCKLLSK